jgi:hypothetical protein
VSLDWYTVVIKNYTAEYSKLLSEPSKYLSAHLTPLLQLASLGMPAKLLLTGVLHFYHVRYSFKYTQ